MINLNEIKLIGRIGNEPEITRTNDNKIIAKFSVATSESWLDKFSSERKERTEWHRIVIYNSKLAEIIENRKTDLKGSLIYISGKLRYEKWVDSKGQDQKTTQIILDATGQFILLPKTTTSEKNNNLLEETQIESNDSDEIPF